MTTSNKKYQPTEDQEQLWVIQYCRLKGHSVHHSPNATGHSREAKLRAIKLKRQGTSAGFPDLLVFVNGQTIAIEMKRQHGGSVSPQQKKWIEILNDHGVPSKVAKGADEAIEFIQAWERSSQARDNNDKEVF